MILLKYIAQCLTESEYFTYKNIALSFIDGFTVYIAPHQEKI